MMDGTEPEFMSPKIPMLPKQFQDLRLIGKGTFSSVYSAHDAKLGRDVAIKAIPNNSESSRYVVKREIEILSKLNHPGIIRLLDVSNTLGATLLIQPLCAMGGLDQKLTDNQFSYLARLSMVDTLLQASQYLHSQGWLHCDIKPANLLLDNRGSVFLSDFGEARPISQTSGANEQVGSIRYMAPEMLEGNAGPSIQTEIYSIGVSIFELLTGNKAFSDDAVIAMQDALTKGLPAIQSNVPSSADWNAVLKKATNVDAKSRYASVYELATDVQRIRESQPVSVRKNSAREYLLRWIKKEPITAGLLFSVIMVGCIGSIAGGSAWLEVSKQSALSKTNESQLVLRSRDSETARKKSEESLRLAKEESENAERNEAETKEAIDAIAALSEELKAQVEITKDLNSKLIASVESFEQSQQKRNAVEQKAVTIGNSAAQIESQFQTDEYWRLLNQAKSHFERDEIELAIEALDKTPQSIRHAEYALLRGLVENRWRYPKRMEMGEIEFDEEDDSEKSVALSRDGRFFARCSHEQLKILSVVDGKIDSFKVPKLRGADRVWLRFNEDATKLLIAVTSEANCNSFSLEHLRGSWALWGSPIQIDGPCFGVTEFYKGRAYLVCAKRTTANEKLEFVDSATGQIHWSYDFDTKITSVNLVKCGWLPPGNTILILSGKRSLLVEDDGLKLKEHKVDFALTNQMDLPKLSFFRNQKQTNSLALIEYRPPKETPISRDRDDWNKYRGEIQRQGESWHKAFVHEAMPGRNAWIRDQGTFTYFVLNAQNGNICLPLLNKKESCFPLAISDSNELFCLVYPEPSKNALFNRKSIQLPKATLVRYDFGAKGLAQLVKNSSPFQKKTPLQVLTRTGSTATNAQIDFFIDTEDTKHKASLASIQYRCYGPDGRHSGTQNVGFRKPMSVIEPNVSNGTKYRIELDAGKAFEILTVDVKLFEGQITELGTLNLKPKNAIGADDEISIVGVVKNAKGVGLANTSVTSKFLPKGTGARPEEVAQEITTDKDGRYRLAGIGIGRVSLSIESHGYLIERDWFSTENSSTRELEKNFSLSRPTRIKLRYAASDYGSSSFTGNNVETNSIELVFDKYPSSAIQYARGIKKRLSDFSSGKNLKIDLRTSGVYLQGGCVIGTSEQSDFNLIAEVGQIANKDNLLTEGKVLLLYGTKSGGERNLKDCCVKILVESISEE